MTGVSRTVNLVNEKIITAQRQSLLQLRDRESIGNDVLRQLQRELDLESMLLDSESVDEEDPSTWSPYGAHGI